MLSSPIPLKFATRPTASKQALGLELQRLALGAHRPAAHDPAVDLGLLDARRGVNGDPLAAERLVHLGGDVGVLERQDTVQQLDHGDLGAEAGEDRGELHPHRPSAQHQQARRDLLEIEDVVRVDDPVAVGGDERQVAAPGPGCQDDVLRLTLFDRAVGFRDLDRVVARQPCGALHPRDLVLSEEVLDALGALGHDLGLVLMGRLEVERDLPAHDAEPGSVPRLLEQVRGVQQRLGRDASAMEAGPAEEGVLLDDADVEAELPRPDPGHVAAWSGPDDHEIVLGFGHPSPSSGTTSRRDSF